jgi:predicted small metal-binding protein
MTPPTHKPPSEPQSHEDESTLSMTCKHCNITIHADDEDELVRRVQAHVGTHERPTELSREHILRRLHRQSDD